jgi:hypothetical protein
MSNPGKHRQENDTRQLFGKILSKNDGHQWANFSYFPQEMLQGMQWSWGPLMRFANPELNFLIYQQVANRALFEPGHLPSRLQLRELRELGSLTYDRASLRGIRGNSPRKIKGNYEIISDMKNCEKNEYNCIPAYWGRQNDVLQSITVGANARLKKLSHVSDSQFAKHQASAAHLLLPETLRFNTSSIVSVYSGEKVVSNVFWGFLPREDLLSLDGNLLSPDDISKIFALWTNTTPGELLLLSIADETDENLCHWKKQTLNHAMVPDVEMLTQKQIAELSELFDQYSHVRWQNPLQEQITAKEKRDLDKSLLNICTGKQDLTTIEKQLDDLYRLSQSLFYNF